MSDFPDNSDLQRAGVGRYPDRTIIAHLKACQQITVEHSRDLFGSFRLAFEEKLLEFVDTAKSNEEARNLQEIVRVLRGRQNELLSSFVDHLSEGFVKFKGKRLNTHTGEEKYRSDMLSLVDDADLEETIALSSIAQRTDEQFSETLWFVKQRLAVLNGGDKVQESNNPVAPVQFCEALRKSLSVLPLTTKAKIIGYKVFDAELAEELSKILEGVNRYLAKEDILPNLHIAVKNSMPFGSSARNTGEAQSHFEEETGQNPAGNSEQGAAQDEYQGGLIQAIRSLQQHIAGAGGGARHAVANPANSSAPRAAAHNGAVGGYSNEQLVTTLHALQTQALSMTASAGSAGHAGVVSTNVGLIGQQLTERLKESAGGQVDPLDMHTIDLVGMLFEYMLSDEQLPDSVKAVLSYLHTPFLKMAFIDSSFFEKAEHPARLLLNNLAEAGIRWVSNDGTSQYEIYTKIKETVSRVLEEFENDVRLFAELLLDFSSYTKKIGRRQDLMEKRVMEKVQGEEKLREVKVRVNKEIRSRTDGKELPSAVLLLLLQPWSDYLAFLLLRYGDESEVWKKALAAVDDTLWSIEAKRDSEDKARQLEVLDGLLDIIESGFETIGYDQSKGKKLIEALVSLQKMAMQSRAPAPAPAPMRDRLESEAAEKAGQEDKPLPKATPEEAKMVENLKMVEFGTWFEFEGGKRLKVAWYNSKTMHYMLVDQMGKKVAMKSGLELARGMLAGKARVIAGSTKPFFERALENILQNLNAKAEAIQPETSNG